MIQLSLYLHFASNSETHHFTVGKEQAKWEHVFWEFFATLSKISMSKTSKQDENIFL